MADNDEPRLFHNILITGATSGIGKAMAERLVREGKNVYVTGRKQDKLGNLVIELHEKKVEEDQTIESFCFDMSLLSSVKTAMDAICDLTLDTVIFNAGVMFPDPRDPTAQDDLPLLEETLKVNVLGHFLMARRLALRRTGQQIRFVCLSSKMAPLRGRLPGSDRWPTTVDGFNRFFARERLFTDGWWSYIDSKLAVIVMSQWLNKMDHTTAVAIHPGVAMTNIVNLIPGLWQKILSPVRSFQNIETPEECAARVIKEAVRNENEGMDGQWFCDGPQPIPRLSDQQKTAFIEFAEKVTDDFMP